MEKEAFIKYIKDGLSNPEIAKIIGCHRTTVAKILKKFNIERKEIKNKICKVCSKNISNNERNRSRCNSCNTRIRRYRTKLAAVTYKGGECQKCGWKGPMAAFEFHHNDDNKEFNIGSAANKSWKIVKKEIDKCELLCSNCHRIEHSKHDDEILLKEIKNYKGSLLQ
jgi:predicted RNA-binding Zn-ribbon protein involved in translation (DUF1610 family)